MGDLIHTLLLISIGMLIESFRQFKSERKAQRQQQPPVTLYNTYTDHGTHERFVTEAKTNNGSYPNFSAWNCEWEATSKYTETRWYVGTDYKPYQVYRRKAFTATPYKHDLE